jgi:hypothetical protein
MCVITSVAISSVIVYLIKKPLSGLIYFAGVFRARGVLAATAGFATGAFFAGAFLTGFSCTIGASAGATSTSAGASTLYGAKVSGCFGLPKKPFKNRSIMFSYVVFNNLVTIH